MRFAVESLPGRAWGFEMFQDGAGRRHAHVFCGWRVFGMTLWPRAAAGHLRDRLETWAEDVSPARKAAAAKAALLAEDRER